MPFIFCTDRHTNICWKYGIYASSSP